MKRDATHTDAAQPNPVAHAGPVHSNSPTIPAPRDSDQYGADRVTAAGLHALADLIALGRYLPPVRPAGFRPPVVPRVVHDLICRVRVATPQDTVPPVAHCAACGLAMPMDGPAPQEEPVDHVDQDDQDDVVPLRVLLDAAAESMSGLPAAALRPMFGLLASVAYRAGRGDGHATDAAGEIGGILAELADTDRPVPDHVTDPAGTCPPWCTGCAFDEREDMVCHFGAVTIVGPGERDPDMSIEVSPSTLVVNGVVTERGVFCDGRDLSTARARELARALTVAADHADGR